MGPVGPRAPERVLGLLGAVGPWVFEALRGVCSQVLHSALTGTKGGFKGAGFDWGPAGSFSWPTPIARHLSNSNCPRGPASIGAPTRVPPYWVPWAAGPFGPRAPEGVLGLLGSFWSSGLFGWVRRVLLLAGSWNRATLIEVGRAPGPRDPRLGPPREESLWQGPGDPLDAFQNDPSAGSPTETLLRLLLPLDNMV